MHEVDWDSEKAELPDQLATYTGKHCIWSV